MKYLILLLFLTLVSCSADEDRIYTLTYRVYYNNSVIKEYVVKSNKKFYIGSDRGSNYIKEGSIVGPTVITTSAPIEIITYSYDLVN